MTAGRCQAWADLEAWALNMWAEHEQEIRAYPALPETVVLDDTAVEVRWGREKRRSLKAQRA